MKSITARSVPRLHNPSPVTARMSASLCVAVPLGFAVLAVLLDQDASWDLANYHWYNPYAFLTGRLERDIAPAHIATYYNPILDVPLYILAQAVPARAVGFLLGLVQGLNFIPLFALGLRLLTALPAERRIAYSALLAVLGLVGGGHLGLVGTTFYDNVLSLFVLVAIYLVVRQRSWTAGSVGNAGKSAWAWLWAAGAVTGSGAGLKLPTAIFCAGLCAAFLVIGPGFIRRIARSFVFGLGVLAGLAAFAGHWMVYLWSAFGNPIFPYFNALFDSPMGLPASYRDTRFVPESLWEALAFPFVMAADPTQAGEAVFRDYRILIAYAVLLATPFVFLVFRRAPGTATRIPPDREAIVWLLAAAWLSYLAWLALFAIYRYLIPLEMLAPLLAAGTVALWSLSDRARTGIIVFLLAAMAITAKPGNWGRVPWGEKLIDLSAPPIPDPGRALIVMTGLTPTAWVIPAFPPAVSFVRLQGYGIHPDDGDTGLNKRVRARVAAHRGAFYLLTLAHERDSAATILARYDLALAAGGCRPIVSHFAGEAELCGVERITARP